MINLNSVKIESVMNELKNEYETNYGMMEPQFGNILAWAGNLALENIANSDALYHNVDHTIMVTLVGQQIIRGKHLKEGGITPHDWLHYVLALLCHDIGYVRGICQNDYGDFVDTGSEEGVIKLPRTGTDAALTPYHVDRSKLFVQERFTTSKIVDVIDAHLICSLIEMTRFPVPDEDDYKDTSSLSGLVRAADFIGQLGDPNHFAKMPALYYEFEEIGANEKYGYENPGDMRRLFAKFFWEEISPHIQEAIGYLEITQEGKYWISSLHSHIFDVEHYRK